MYHLLVKAEDGVTVLQFGTKAGSVKKTCRGRSHPLIPVAGYKWPLNH